MCKWFFVIVILYINKIRGKLCEDIASIELNRVVRRKGFHRELSMEGTVIFNEKMKTTELIKNYILIVENFPSDVFIDPYEVESTLLFEKVLFNDSINIEDPAYKSSPLEIYIYTPLIKDKFNFTLPLHLRYQRIQNCYAKNEGYHKRFQIPKPSIYLAQKFSDSSLKEFSFPCYRNFDVTCKWINIKLKKDLIIPIKVPVGCNEHKILINKQKINKMTYYYHEKRKKQSIISNKTLKYIYLFTSLNF